METVEMVFWQLFPVLLSLAIPTFLVIMGWLSKKVGERIDAEHRTILNDFVNSLVVQGVGFAEQVAEQKRKENEEIHGEEKLYLAIDYVLEELEKYDIVDIAGEEIARKVEAVLGQETMLRKNLGGQVDENYDE